MQKETFLQKYKRIQNSPEIRKQSLENRYFLPRFIFWGILAIIVGAIVDSYVIPTDGAYACAIFATFAYGYALIYARKKAAKEFKEQEEQK